MEKGMHPITSRCGDWHLSEPIAAAHWSRHHMSHAGAVRAGTYERVREIGCDETVMRSIFFKPFVLQAQVL